MKNWGPWDWIAWSSLGLSALASALGQAISSLPDLKNLMPKVFQYPYWNFAPLALFVLSGVVFLSKELGGNDDARNQGAEGLSGVSVREATVSKASLQLQFYGDERVPRQISHQNVINWFAYFSPRILLQQRDVAGKIIPEGTFSSPLSWVIFITFDRPISYRQAVVSYANQDNAPITEVKFSTDRSIVVTTNGPITSTVMDVHTEP